MKYLTRGLMAVSAALGITGCTQTDNQKLESAVAGLIPASYLDYVLVPKNFDYTTITWDKAQVMAIDVGIDHDDAISLFRLSFESRLKNGTRAIRTLTFDEVKALGIESRKDLNAYLDGKCKTSDGYIGPNIML